MREKKTSFKAHAAGLAGVILLILGILCLPSDHARCGIY